MGQPNSRIGHGKALFHETFPGFPRERGRGPNTRVPGLKER